MVRHSSRYQFTGKAERDLEGIIDHTIREWGASQANTYLDGLETRAKLLAENPDLGTTRGYEAGTWALVDIDLSRLDSKARVSISACPNACWP